MKDLRFDNPAAAECNHRSAPRRPGDCDLPRQIDQPDQPSTLPQAELNPLLNPLLSQNMGRWAEVYFTSPPEKREQAVQELLRELESQRSSGEDRVTTTDAVQHPPQLSGTDVADESLVNRSHLDGILHHGAGPQSDLPLVWSRESAGPKILRDVRRCARGSVWLDGTPGFSGTPSLRAK